MSHRVAVVGGGIIGLSSAYYLAKAGHQVTIIDANQPDADNCSHGNLGLVVPSHFVPLAAPGVLQYGIKMMFNKRSPFGYHLPPSWQQILWSLRFATKCTHKHVADSVELLAELNLTSRALYDELHTEFNQEFEWMKKGMMILCIDQKSLDAEQHEVERARSLGLDVRMLNKQETAALDPDIEMNMVGCAHYAQDCHLSPTEFMSAMRRRFPAMGVKEMFGERIKSITTNIGEVELNTEKGATYRFDKVVMAGGYLAGKVRMPNKKKLSIMPGKGYSMTVQGMKNRPSVPSILIGARVAITPMHGGLRIGGTLEVGNFNDRVDQNRVEGIIKSTLQHFPTLEEDKIRATPVWHGHRPCSPDGLPFIGTDKEDDRIIHASGHSMMGVSLAPVTGMLVAQIASREVPSISVEKMSPNRYD
ncbi:MAG TPA: FAD-dependent oxidoreductase [Fimbriimonas sp.]|nr:FAD-dependent oxidoreductase [Fimbriimonas sp.]